MSVKDRFRNESKIEFVYTARLLAVSIIKSCVDTKKGRYTATVSEPAVQSAWKVYECVKRANSIYPTNQHEAQLRRDNLILAKAELYVLDSKIGVAHEFYHFSDHDLDEMDDYIDSEHKLIDGVMESDQKRYKNLPGNNKTKDNSGEVVKLLKELTDFVLGRNQKPKNLTP